MEITCPECNTEFEATEWDDNKCPNCNLEYYWSEE